MMLLNRLLMPLAFLALTGFVTDTAVGDIGQPKILPESASVSDMAEEYAPGTVFLAPRGGGRGGGRSGSRGRMGGGRSGMRRGSGGMRGGRSGMRGGSGMRRSRSGMRSGRSGARSGMHRSRSGMRSGGSGTRRSRSGMRSRSGTGVRRGGSVSRRSGGTRYRRSGARSGYRRGTRSGSGYRRGSGHHRSERHRVHGRHKGRRHYRRGGHGYGGSRYGFSLYFGWPYYGYYYPYSYYGSWPYGDYYYYYDNSQYYYLPEDEIDIGTPIEGSSQESSVDENTFADVRAKLEKQRAEEIPKVNARLTDIGNVFRQGNYLEAMNMAHSAVEAYPYHPVLEYTYSQALFANGRYDRAADLLREAVRKTDVRRQEVIFGAELYPDRTALLNKIALLREASAKDPANSDLQLLLGYQLAAVGDYEEAGRALAVAKGDYVNTPAAARLERYLIESGKMR